MVPIGPRIDDYRVIQCVHDMGNLKYQLVLYRVIWRLSFISELIGRVAGQHAALSKRSTSKESMLQLKKTIATCTGLSLCAKLESARTELRKLESLYGSSTGLTKRLHSLCSPRSATENMLWQGPGLVLLAFRESMRILPDPEEESIVPVGTADLILDPLEDKVLQSYGASLRPAAELPSPVKRFGFRNISREEADIDMMGRLNASHI